MKVTGSLQGFCIDMKDSISIVIGGGLEVELKHGTRPIHTINCGVDSVCIYLNPPPREYVSWYVRAVQWIERKLLKGTA